jgi:hypothetical protein
MEKLMGNFTKDAQVIVGSVLHGHVTLVMIVAATFELRCVRLSFSPVPSSLLPAK